MAKHLGFSFNNARCDETRNKQNLVLEWLFHQKMIFKNVYDISIKVPHKEA